ncbi:RNA recognition motif-containing protein [Cyclospora cayetanensis]|uniref:RNA recognition motif-containing protein n=1 Tax=Cyclospora cayetanensis TaxID=88456 RepID=A0A1D3D842_9EIME|nr:RNA recognition motif-containing protein [Cyclospora cayetanensis]
MADASLETNGASESLAQEAAAGAAAAAGAVAASAGGVPTGGPVGEKIPPSVEIKLFIGRVPQSMDEDGLRPVFEEFGEVREVIIIRDKATGKHKNSAFIKMASIAGADSAIKGLHNIRVLDSSMGAISVKYATGEAERLGLSPQACEPGVPQAKLFVGSLPRTLKDEELKAFFQDYGQVEEIFIMKDSTTGTGRGCAFVKMGQKEEALFAINSLNGKHVWTGCPRPMEVRFAESRAQRQQMSEKRVFQRAGSVGCIDGGQFFPADDVVRV